jgi:predicted deacylase
MSRPEALTIGPLTAAPGTKVSGALEVPPQTGDLGTSIPITIVHGAGAGPVLALVAGIHGMEYVPIIALQRLRASLEPKTLHGSVVMVHVANLPSFFGRTVYYSPIDGKNLNRVFPGKPAGTLSERIAYTITRDIVTPATHLLDLHGGDGNESLRPYAYWITTGPPPVAEASRAMAIAFGLDRIVVDRQRPVDPDASIFLSNTAILRGKPAVTTETGGLGRADDASVALVERGVGSVMLHLGMRPVGPPPPDRPVWVGKEEVLRAGATGIFHAAVDCGERVASGTALGRITDFHGETLAVVNAPFAGEVLYIVRTPPVTRGEPLAMIGASA